MNQTFDKMFPLKTVLFINVKYCLMLLLDSNTLFEARNKKVLNKINVYAYGNRFFYQTKYR